MCLLPKQYGFKDGLTSQEYFDLLTGLGDWENYNKAPTANFTPQQQLQQMLDALRVKANPPTVEQVKQMIEKAGYTLLMDIGAYWGHLMHNCKITVTERIPTACVYVSKTESVVCMDINPQFYSMIKDTDRVGVLYHELQHIALSHLKRATDETNHKQWNFATDLAINSGLVKIKPSVMTLPDDAGGGHGGQGTADGNAGESDDGTEGDAVAREILIRALKRAAEQTTAGSVPHFVEEAIEALEKQRPKNWHKELRRFYRSTVEGNDRARTWARPNRRFGLWEAGSKVGEGKKLIIGIDTSGSMSTEDIQHILAECHSMLKCGVDAKVMFFDTEVHSTIKLTKHCSIKECGRGGTDFKDFFDKAAKQRPDALVVFTDGDDVANLSKSVSKDVPVLWVLIAGDRQHGTCANFGHKVLLD
jgi:predicted metal-dependent peptidase